MYNIKMLLSMIDDYFSSGDKRPIVIKAIGDDYREIMSGIEGMKNVAFVDGSTEENQLKDAFKNQYVFFVFPKEEIASEIISEKTGKIIDLFATFYYLEKVGTSECSAIPIIIWQGLRLSPFMEGAFGVLNQFPYASYDDEKYFKERHMIILELMDDIVWRKYAMSMAKYINLPEQNFSEFFYGLLCSEIDIVNYEKNKELIEIVDKKISSFLVTQDSCVQCIHDVQDVNDLGHHCYLEDGHLLIDDDSFIHALEIHNSNYISFFIRNVLAKNTVIIKNDYKYTHMVSSPNTQLANFPLRIRIPLLFLDLSRLPLTKEALFVLDATRNY